MTAKGQKGKSKYHPGMIINRLTLIEDTGLRSGCCSKWRVLCYCGEIFEVRPSSIMCGNTKSCGCFVVNNKFNLPTKPTGFKRTRYIDYTNFIYNGLQFLEKVDKHKGEINSTWLMKCSCGEIFKTKSNNIFNGNTKSCGCYRRLLPKINSGPKHHCYDHSISEEERLIRFKRPSQTKAWRADIYKRDRYTCQLCGFNSNLRAHHLNGFNWAIDERYDINNGITLCEECHNDFHSKYGKGQNTREQFIDFVKKLGEL